MDYSKNKYRSVNHSFHNNMSKSAYEIYQFKQLKPAKNNNFDRSIPTIAIETLDQSGIMQDDNLINICHDTDSS